MNDILSELEKQVGPLEKQSEKAREYLQVKRRFKDKEMSMHFFWKAIKSAKI